MTSIPSSSHAGMTLWDHRLWTFKKSSLDIPPDLPDRFKDIQLEDSEDEVDEDNSSDFDLDRCVKSHPDDKWLKYVDAPHTCDLCGKLVIREDRLPSNALGPGGRCILRVRMSDKKMWKAGRKCPLFRYLCSVFQEGRRLRPHRYSVYDAVASDVDLGISYPPSSSPRGDLFMGVVDGKIKFLYRWPRFLYDDQDSPAGDTLLPLPEALYYTRVASDWAYSRAKKWIEDCTLNHTSCRLEPSGFVPTRLLDVAAIRGNNICLVESKTVPNIQKSARWAALSYVWGGLQPVRTLEANINDHRKGIPLDRLPPTIQHSITVCQNIAIPYLWIDCLCIIQDDNDDLAVELQFMAQIYQHSTVTINAASAASVHQGFLQDRPLYFYEDTIQPVQINFEPSKCSANAGVTGFLLKNNLSYALQDFDPIRTRAWTYQERKLPIRSLHYSTAGIEWSCRHLVASTVTNTEKPYDDRLLGEGPTLAGQELTPWSVIVQDYTHRKLSFPSDKITAVSAIAAIYHQEQQKTYVAGLWKEDMPGCLIWHVGPSEVKPRYEMYTGPSWSWASTDSRVSYQLASNEEGVVYHSTVWKAEAEPAMPKARFAAVKSAFLLLRGRVHRAALEIGFGTVGSEMTKNVKVTVIGVGPYADKIGVRLDAWEDGWLGDSGLVSVEVLLLPLFERTKHDDDMGRPGWGGLVLVEAKQGAYRRIGFFTEYFYKRTVGRVSFADFIVGAEEKDLFIV
ncbi:heterokaryon incompatibility protein-domain-containing protein [Triangularia verruculosa]|uniref:Heterokaryon incompatibility protein-domain-containing protein n=1 Tax=Triangularia verruculosa TaxID=2587418 RepID=A0AAN6XCR1_9PEZI|nr:heterokaryon incompatibility protein-domain-containing protein [Triangularia verruculosa]